MENIHVEQKAQRSLKLTNEHVKAYAEMTGDYNPLHFIGDSVTAEAEVQSVHVSKPVIQLKVMITRENGETVLDGEAW